MMLSWLDHKNYKNTTTLSFLIFYFYNKLGNQCNTLWKADIRLVQNVINVYDGVRFLPEYRTWMKVTHADPGETKK